jgi:hypothetical protein
MIRIDVLIIGIKLGETLGERTTSPGARMAAPHGQPFVEMLGVVSDVFGSPSLVVELYWLVHILTSSQFSEQSGTVSCTPPPHPHSLARPLFPASTSIIPRTTPLIPPATDIYNDGVKVLKHTGSNKESTRRKQIIMKVALTRYA